MGRKSACFFWGTLTTPLLPLRIVIKRIGPKVKSEQSYATEPCDSAERVYSFWRDVVSRRPEHEEDKEQLISILLNSKLVPVAYHVVSIGCLNETLAHMREIFRPAIILAAYGFILVHNHPSGDPNPSQSDHHLTKRVRENAALLEIRFIDHVVVGEPRTGLPSYFSFREAGLL